MKKTKEIIKKEGRKKLEEKNGIPVDKTDLDTMTYGEWIKKGKNIEIINSKQSKKI